MKNYIKNIGTWTVTLFVAILALTILCVVSQKCLKLVWTQQIKNVAITKSNEDFQQLAQRKDCTIADYNTILNYAKFTCSNGIETVWIP